MEKPKNYNIKLGIPNFFYTAWVSGCVNEIDKEKLEKLNSNPNGTIKIYNIKMDYGGNLLFSPFGKYGRIANFFRKDKDSIELKLNSRLDGSLLELKTKDL